MHCNLYKIEINDISSYDTVHESETKMQFNKKKCYCSATFRVFGLPEIGEEENKPKTERGCIDVGYHLLRDFTKIKTTQELKDNLLPQAYS